MKSKKSRQVLKGEIKKERKKKRGKKNGWYMGSIGKCEAELMFSKSEEALWKSGFTFQPCQRLFNAMICLSGSLARLPLSFFDHLC